MKRDDDGWQEQIRRARLWFLTALAVLGAVASMHAAGWDTIRVPGVWSTNIPALLQPQDGFGWYRAWLKPHDSFFTPHERNLFAESVTLNIRGLADAHEAFVNGTRVGGGGGFPPAYVSGREGNHRYKIPPGLLRRGEWNEIAVRVYSASGAGGFETEAPFVMDYFNECVLEGEWEWQAGDGPGRLGSALKDKPARAAFDRYHESSRVLGEAGQFMPGPRKSPEESARLFKPADDLMFEQLLHEPLVAQPTHLSFDVRGRLWVAQYRQYPYPAGAKMLSRDKYYRAQYDRVPAPPPHHTRGRDMISVHEDTDGDGVYDRHKVFLDGLNMANAVLPGRGGIWVMHTPYLLFYPDGDGDDVPDGPPVVHLAGFGLEDTHSVANGLVWGPDGWIYGAQGSTTSSRVVRPGVDVPPFGEGGAPRWSAGAGANPAGVYFEGCMVWRYQPERRIYEIFAEGSGNVFGLELDGEGRLFSGHNGAETRGWYYQQGAYYMKQGVDPGKFGPSRNPYAFGELPWMKPSGPLQRFTHFLAVVEGTALPEARQGQMFWIDPVHSLVLASERRAAGSTFGTRDLGAVLTSEDAGFRPVYIVNAPDGSLLVADFYEHYIAHGQHYQSQIDPTTGRIYRLRGRAGKLERDVDLSRRTTDELIGLLGHPNRWHRQTAARLLGWRATPEILGRLRERLRPADAGAPGAAAAGGAGASDGHGRVALGALWALQVGGGLDEDTALTGLRQEWPVVREWTVRLLGDRGAVSDRLASVLAERARVEPDVRVRAQLAASARRLPAGQGLPVVRALMARAEDAADPCVPLLCWWALETHLGREREAVLSMFDEKEMWAQSLVVEHILSRLMRRFAVEGRRADLLVCARLLRQAAMAGNPASMDRLRLGLEEAFRGRPMTGLPDELQAALASAGRASLAMRLRQGETGAVSEALVRMRDAGAGLEQRLECIRTLGELRVTAAIPGLLAMATNGQPAAVARMALTALSVFEDASLAESIVPVLTKLPVDVRPAAWAFLLSRRAWSEALMAALESGRLRPTDVPADAADRLRLARDPGVRERAVRVLGGSAAGPSAALARRVNEVEAILGRAPGNPYAGEKLFTQRCAACHKLFFKGGNVGPDLTAYQRDNLGTLLTSVLDPNAEIREGYASVEIETVDGRTLGGFLVERDAQVVVMRGLDGQDVTLRATEIRTIEPTGRSLMPEGLLDDLGDDQLRDLFAYLRSSQPFTR